MSLMESISFHHLCPLGPIEAVVPYACADTMLRADVRFGHMLLSGLMICLLPELSLFLFLWSYYRCPAAQ